MDSNRNMKETLL